MKTLFYKPTIVTNMKYYFYECQYKNAIYFQCYSVIHLF